MLTVINLAIGLTFVYLVVSLVVSAFNELVLSTLDKRADFLREGLEELLGDPGRVEELLRHGLVDALSRKRNGTPSYIGPEAFTAAVLDQIKPATTAAVRTIDDFKSGIAKLPDEKLRQSLTAIFDQAGNDVAAFKQGVAAWYDRSMDRVTGWYKRYTQKWLFWLGFLLAVACNVDTVHIIQALSTDPKLLAATVDQAITTAKSPPPQPSGTSSQDTTDVIKQLVSKASDAISNLSSVSVPIGWSKSQRQYLCDPGHFVSALLGWLLTGLAASLGAPFWFDTLQRFVNIRSNGRSPDEKDIGTKK